MSFNDSPRKHANPKFIFTLIKQQFSKHVNPIHKHEMFKSLRKFYWRGRIVIKLPLSSTSNFRNENLFFYDLGKEKRKSCLALKLNLFEDVFEFHTKLFIS